MVATLSFFLVIGTRKHPVKAAAQKKRQNAGLTNPLQLLTNKNMFSAKSFADMEINDKMVWFALVLECITPRLRF